MLTTARMEKIAVIAHREEAANLLAALHEAGVLEIKEPEEILRLAQRFPRREPGELAALHARIKRILDFYELVKRSAEVEGEAALKNIFAAEEQKRAAVEAAEIKELLAQVEKALPAVETKVKSFEDYLNKLEEEKSLLEDRLEALHRLEKLPANLEHLRHDYTRCFLRIGIVEKRYEKESSFMERLSPEALVYAQEIDEKSVLLLVCALKKRREEVEQELAKIKFESVKVPEVSGTPQEVIEQIESRLKQIQEEQDKTLKEALEFLRGKEEELLTNQELLRIEIERESAFSFLCQTKSAITFEAWMPEKNAKRVEKICESAARHGVVIERLENGAREEPPTLMQNPKPAKPFEALVEMYGLPRYSEIDPTLFVAVFFTLFFGFMLTDAAYGLVLAAGAAIFRKSVFGRGEAGKVADILLLGGVSAIVFGVLTSGYLGDFPQRFFGFEIPALWINPFGTQQGSFLGHPISPVMLLLVTSILLGALHMNIGIVITLKNALRERHFRAAAGEVGTLVLELGLILVLFKFFGVEAIGEELFRSGLHLIGLGALLIMYRNGLLGFFSCTGFLGDLISYSRILALAMATGGLALAVNVTALIAASMLGLLSGGEANAFAAMLSRMGENPALIVSFAIVVLILVLGHLASIAINTLGGAIHSIRLHYAEFFGHFYEGGGRKYSPFKVTRERTVLKEE